MIKSGLLWDLEHFSAWLTGLAIGPRLARRDRQPGRYRDHAEVRALVSSIVAAFALSTMVESFYPGIGGLVGPGPVGPVQVRGFGLVLLELVITLMIAGALPRLGATPWWVAVAGTIAIGVNSLLNAGPHPGTGEAVCAGSVLAVLIRYRRAWPWRADRTAPRALGALAVLMVGYAALTAVGIWAAAGHFDPVPDPLVIARQTASRFTFTVGPLVPLDGPALAVLRISGLVWALIFIGWLSWAMYSGGRREPQ